MSSIKEVETNDTINTINETEINDDVKKVQLIKENLQCLNNPKINYINNPNESFGYLIIQKNENNENNKDKMEIYIIPELLTYLGYKSQIEKKELKLDYYVNIKSTLNNEYKKYWLPVYINEEHYIKNKELILNVFKEIKGDKDETFKSQLIFEIIPLILKKIFIGMLNNKKEIVTLFTKCYFKMILLFKKLIDEYDEDLIKYLNNKLNLIYKNDYNVEKTIIPNIENFIILLQFSNRNIYNKKMRDIWYTIYEEYLVRQIYWIFNNKGEIKEILEKIKLDNQFIKSKKVLYIKDEILKESIKTGNCLIKINDNKSFINNLIKDEIYEKILNYFLPGIYDKKYLKAETDKKLKGDFQNMFNNCTESIKKKVVLTLINNDNKYYEYFKLTNKGLQIYEELFLYNPIILDNKVSKLLYDEKYKEFLEILETAYKTQRVNNLLVLLFFTQKKINEKGFLERLKNNYGVNLEINDFIKEMKEKVLEINSYGKMYEYIGSEYGIGISDIELIQNAYETAKWKKYVGYTYIKYNNGYNKNNYYKKGRQGRK